MLPPPPSTSSHYTYNECYTSIHTNGMCRLTNNGKGSLINFYLNVDKHNSNTVYTKISKTIKATKFYRFLAVWPFHLIVLQHVKWFTWLLCGIDIKLDGTLVVGNKFHSVMDHFSRCNARVCKVLCLNINA